MKNKNLDKFLVLDKNQQTLDSFLADVKRKLHSESHTEEPSPMKIQSQEKKQKLNHISPDSSFTTESADPVVSQHNDKNASPQKKQPHPYLKRVREALKNVRNKRPEVLSVLLSPMMTKRILPFLHSTPSRL
ncbi:hypothetical protein C9374_004511 [Naegleria lovaniensis]|uniref:Uncharacterized protein n=1 Tax=Naegleria lovaniensis TaxID=51637 RepID=A0AA88GLI3_NAELO|nr:uncharacterized protein C9374_004511 [Naegleria lovaniensis]KAG2383174.1 hypothetical protein C9374_004511 [Naegleria lovaniensis]